MSTKLPAFHFTLTDAELLAEIARVTHIRDLANQIATDCPSEDVRVLIIKGVREQSHILDGLHVERVRRGITAEGMAA